jgi:DNA polymerase/3'-5' exonuclease PolX
MDDRKLEQAIALIIACTRRVKRPKDIVTLAENIRYAEQQIGGLKGVGEKVGLSVQQLKDFLAVEDLRPEVKELVASRQIDSVDVVKTISKLLPIRQSILANYLVKGRISSKDVRIITTSAKKKPHKPISKVIDEYAQSRDITLYVVEMRLPEGFINHTSLQKKFEKIIGRGGMKNFHSKGGVAVLEMTVEGYKKLRRALLRKGMTLRKYVTSILTDLASVR